MKKILFISSVAFLSTNVLAGLALVPVASDVTGTYVGVKVGYQSGKNDFVQKLNETKRNITKLTHDKKSDAFFGVNLGYGTSMNHLYLGGEASLDYNGPEEKSEFYSQEGDLIRMETRPTYSANIDFTPGLILTPRLLLFGRVGLGYSNYHMRVIYKPGETGQTKPISAYEKSIAVRYGAGLRYALTRDLNIGVDYTRIEPTGDVTYKSPNNYKYVVKPTRTQIDANVNYMLDHADQSSAGPSLMND